MKIWMKDGKFIALDAKAVAALTEDELIDYHQDKLADDKAKLDAIVADVEKKATKEEIAAIAKSVTDTRDEIMKAVIKQGETLAEMARKSGAPTVTKGALRKAFDEVKEKLVAIKDRSRKEGFQFVVDLTKAVVTQTYGDIDAGSDFAQMRPGVIDQPVRRPRFRDLFGSIPLSTEVYKYVEQDSVVRDAQNVANCTAITTSLTKETLLVSSIEPVKVKDMIKACIDFLDDYAFMQSRINKLLNQSVALQVDEQVLLGTGIAPEMNSIDSVASEFSAANPILVLTLKIQAANFVDLILGMAVQVEMLGLENSFRPNIAVVNRGDWFTLVESKKDANENYLDYRVTRLPNGSVMIGDLEVVTSPIVAVNTCYVFDSTQGEILDRRQLVIDIAFENGTDWEADIVAIKGSERLNFLVPNEVANAFMKCSDVATAITAITAP